MPNSWNHNADTIRPPRLTREQRAQIPTLVLLDLHRRCIDAGWPPSAYEEVAAWCSEHHLPTALHWRRFAHVGGLK
jgi:hypothetical protein